VNGWNGLIELLPPSKDFQSFVLRNKWVKGYWPAPIHSISFTHQLIKLIPFNLIHPFLFLSFFTIKASKLNEINEEMN